MYVIPAAKILPPFTKEESTAVTLIISIRLCFSMAGDVGVTCGSLFV
jgi:hypothetical protein